MVMTNATQTANSKRQTVKVEYFCCSREKQTWYTTVLKGTLSWLKYRVFMIMARSLL